MFNKLQEVFFLLITICEKDNSLKINDKIQLSFITLGERVFEIGRISQLFQPMLIFYN